MFESLKELMYRIRNKGNATKCPVQIDRLYVTVYGISL